MKRKVTDLEQKLINDGWCLTIKRYTGKHSEKTHCYEYHKTSDIRNENKTYNQIIVLDKTRSQIVDYGIKNLFVEFLNTDELLFVKFLFIELEHFVEKIAKEPQQINPFIVNVEDVEWEEKSFKNDLPKTLTPEQLDELYKESEENDNKGVQENEIH